MNCKKITYKEIDTGGEKLQVLLGLVLEETKEFVKFKTGKGREYLIHKTMILELKDTNIEFISEDSP